MITVLHKSLSAIAALSLVLWASSNVAIADTGDGDVSVYYADNDLKGPSFAAPDIQEIGQDRGRDGDKDRPLAGLQSQENFLASEFARAIALFDRKWGDLPQTQLLFLRPLKQGAVGKDVASLRQRLGMPAGDIFDASLAEKIFAYRRDHGLADGFAYDDKIFISLNKGHEFYRHKLSINYQRASELPNNLGKRFILVDAAEQQLYMYEGQRVIDTMRVIVGKPDEATPMMAGLIRYSVLNPYWNIPPDLTRDRYAPKVIMGGKAYLQRTGFEALSDWTENARILSPDEVDWHAVARGDKELRLRQRPGPGNGMGNIKFMFPNDFGVYLHDTPGKALFNEKSRTLSAGCVRVEKPWLLAQWLYGERPQISDNIAEHIVPLDEPVPVYLTYFTAVPTQFGFHFRDDIYDRDRRTQISGTLAKNLSDL